MRARRAREIGKRRNTLLSVARDMPSSGLRGAIDLLAVGFLLFMAFSAVGWAYETVNDMICRQGFYPRAALMGPWCPIYGIGGLLISCLSWVVRPGRRGLAKVGEVVVAAVAIALLVTFVELAGSYACEAMMGYMPWDYSPYWGNFEGRIAPEFTLRFVIGGLVFLYWLEPTIVRAYRSHRDAGVIAALVLLVLFVADNVLEVAGVWAGFPVRAGIPF